MKPNKHILRCYAKKEPDNTWLAVCVDLNLLAQGNNGQEAIDRLHWMIKQYACQTLADDSKCHSKLIPKKTSLPLLINYYWIRFRAKPCKASQEAKAYFFTTHFPVIPS